MSARTLEPVNLDAVETALEALIRRDGKPVILDDKVTGKQLNIPPDSAAARDGLLPVFLVAGEAVWREVTGKGFGIELRPDPGALLGYRVDRIGAGSYSTVMLATMEAASQAATQEAILVNQLQSVWAGSSARADLAAARIEAPTVRSTPAPTAQSTGPTL
jgi:hypothetical protein